MIKRLSLIFVISTVVSCSDFTSKKIFFYNIRHDKINDKIFVNISFDSALLKKFDNDDLLKFIESNTVWTAFIEFRYRGITKKFFRNCQYDSWNKRYYIEDSYSDSRNVYYFFDDFIRNVLIFEMIPFPFDYKVNEDVLYVSFEMKLQSFPPPLNLILQDIYKIHVKNAKMRIMHE